MKTYEFITQITSTGQLAIPSTLADYLPYGQAVRVIVTLTDSNQGSNGDLPRGMSGQELLKLAGTISDDDAKLMMQVIEEECERVDPHEWQ